MWPTPKPFLRRAFFGQNLMNYAKESDTLAQLDELCLMAYD